MKISEEFINKVKFYCPMANQFSDNDLGKIVLLTYNPNKMETDFFEREFDQVRIPYTALLDYEFHVGTEPTSSRIEATNAIDISEKLGGTSEVSTLGEIIEITDTYLKLQLVKA